MKKEEDTDHRLNKVVMELDRESGNTTDNPKIKLREILTKNAEVSKKEEDGLHEDLNYHRSLADEEVHCCKQKIGETEEDSQISANGQEKDATYSLDDVKKDLINEVLEESNGSHVEGFQVCTNGRESKGEDTDELLADRLKKIVGSHEMKMKKEKVEGADQSDSGRDYLEVIEEIVFNFDAFVDYLFLILKYGQREDFKQKERIGLLDKICFLLENTTQGVSMFENMGNMKIDENQKEYYFNREMRIRQIFGHLLQISACLERSFDIGMDSLLKNTENCTENELSLCEGDLNQSKEELGAIKLRIRELKAKERHASPENGSAEMQKETRVLEMEGGDATGISEKWKQSSLSNDSDCCAFPQFRDGIGR